MFYKSFLLTALLFFSHGCTQEQQSAQKAIQKPLEVKVITVEKKNIPIWKRYTGKTKASNKQEVRTRVSGILEKRYVQDGEYVHKGEKLFQIEQSEYIAALNNAKAQKLQDEAALKLALANVERYKPLVKEGLAPRATLEEYEAQVEKLKASILGDTAEINKAKLNLEYTTIKAPISGKVSARRVDVGNLVGLGESTLLTTIVQTNPIYTYFSPSQSDVMMMLKYKSQQKPSAFIELQNEAGYFRRDGYVDFSDNIVDPQTSTITQRATIQNPNHTILPGTFVYINVFVTDKHKFLMIPPDVILNDQLGKYVYIADQNNSAKRVDIQTGLSNKYYIAVTKGLKGGERLVVSGLMKVHENTPLSPTDVTKSEGIDAILEKNHLIPKTDDK